MSINVPHIQLLLFRVFYNSIFLLSLLFQSRSQVVLGKVKSVELVLRIRILKWSSEDFHPLRIAVRRKTWGRRGRLVMGGDACWSC